MEPWVFDETEHNARMIGELTDCGTAAAMLSTGPGGAELVRPAAPPSVRGCGSCTGAALLPSRPFVSCAHTNPFSPGPCVGQKVDR